MGIRVPELSERHYEKIKNSNRIAVPGCHASGFIACVYPLLQAGVIDKSQRLSCYSLTGYSGGGKKLIATVGIEDIIVVDTGDALLICEKDSAGNIKKVLENLKICNRTEYL